ncbi:hypothetical protein ABIF90_008397 [Bradyrhizobium japonicum]
MNEFVPVERDGPTMFARIGVMRALNRHYVPKLNPKGKEPHWGGRRLKSSIRGRVSSRPQSLNNKIATRTTGKSPTKQMKNRNTHSSRIT